MKSSGESSRKAGELVELRDDWLTVGSDEADFYDRDHDILVLFASHKRYKIDFKGAREDCMVLIQLREAESRRLIPKTGS